MKKNNVLFSIVIVCFNEQAAISNVIKDLIKELDKIKISYEILAVDNGSLDNTGKIIDKIAKANSRVRKIKVYVNQGKGNGVIEGLKSARGQILGFMDGDNQMDVKYLINCLNLIIGKKGNVLSKGWRKIRHDNLWRKIVSFFYNLIMNKFLNIKAKDINCFPKLFTRQLYNLMAPLESKDWFIDAEIMIKAKKNNAKIYETPIIFKKRKGGNSSVNLLTILEFIKNIIRFKLRNF